MAKAVVTASQNLREIARQAGGDPNLIMFDPATSEIEMDDVTQAALDAAVTNYATLTPTSTYIEEMVAQIGGGAAGGHVQTILDRGFLDPGGSGKTLSLSTLDSLNWLQLYTVDKLTPDGRSVVFPLLYSTIDGMSTITVANDAEVEKIYSQTALLLDDTLRAAAAANQSVVAATTIAAAESARDTFLAT